MIEKILCEKCGEQMVSTHKDRTMGMTCPKCGWGWVTSHFDSIDTDQTAYSIYLKPGNSPDISNIKLITSICTVNFIEAKRILLSEADVCIYKANNESYADYSKAGKVKHIASLLQKAGMKFYITPDFPYDLTEL